MIEVFLIVLIMALIIANMLVAVAKPKRDEEKEPAGDYFAGGDAQVPEVIEKIEDLHEHTSLIKGTLSATNQKLELLNKRVSTLENAVTFLSSEKVMDEKITLPIKGEKNTLARQANSNQPANSKRKK